MKIPCAIALDYQSNPKIKVTKDCPQITIDVYTEDINLLKSWIETGLEIGPKED